MDGHIEHLNIVFNVTTLYCNGRGRLVVSKPRMCEYLRKALIFHFLCATQYQLSVEFKSVGGRLCASGLGRSAGKHAAMSASDQSFEGRITQVQSYLRFIHPRGPPRERPPNVRVDFH